MEYQYPVSMHHKYWNPYSKKWNYPDLVAIERARLEVLKEDQLPFPKPLAKLRKEMDKATHGTPGEREKWEETFNKIMPWRGWNTEHQRWITVYQATSAGYTWYGETRDIYHGPVQDYWFTVLGIARQPEPVAAPVQEPCRLIAFL